MRPEEINSCPPPLDTRAGQWYSLLKPGRGPLTREKGFGGFRASNVYRAHYTRPAKKTVRRVHVRGRPEGGFHPSGWIKKRTRSLIISVEAQESAKRRSSAWRAARKSARVTAPVYPVVPTAPSIRLSASSLATLRSVSADNYRAALNLWKRPGN